MPHVRELAHGKSPDALRRRIRRDDLGMGLLERDQLPDERVVFGIGELGPVLHVIEARVPPDLLPEPGRSRRRGLRLRHGPILGGGSPDTPLLASPA